MSDEYRKLRYVRFYKDRVNVGAEGYNPTVTVYYGSDDAVVRIEEDWRGETWAQTVSGSNYAQQWPDYNRVEMFKPWEKITV